MVKASAWAETVTPEVASELESATGMGPVKGSVELTRTEAAMETATRMG